MQVAQNHALGLAVRVVPPASVGAVRELLARSLTGLSLGQAQADPEVDDPGAMPPDEPPVIEPPGPYHRPAIVGLSARFIRQLRRDYARDGEGRSGRIGRLEDVQAWLDSLTPSKVKPRRFR